MGIDLVPLKADFEELVAVEAFPFANVNVQRIRRICDFKLHALRNRFAIILAIKGNSQEFIMSKVGWSSAQSFLRYVRIPVSMFSQFESYSQAYDFLT